MRITGQLLTSLIVIILSGTALFAAVDLSELKGSVLAVFQLFRAPWDRRGQDKERPVFQKPHGFAYAKFEIAQDLPPTLRVGIFSETTSYHAWVRFSSDTPGTPGDQAKNTIGLAIKLLGANSGGDQPSQDFLLQNHPAFFTDNSKELEALFKGTLKQENPAREAQVQENLDAMDRDVDTYLDGNPWVMQKPVPSILSSKYWSAVPYKFGPQKFAKYFLEPRLRLDGTSSSTDPNYLKKDLAARLGSATTHCFDLYIQVTDDNDETPVELASKVWDEKKTPGVRIGTLMLPGGQDTNPNPNVTTSLAFRPGNARAEHYPAGELNLARTLIYKKMWELRREKHNLKLQDPVSVDVEDQEKNRIIQERLAAVSCN